MLEDLTLFAMAQKDMDWLARRQEILAENIANADTPKYKAKDLESLDFKSVMEKAAPTIRAATTDPRHVSPEVQPTTFKTVVERRPEESKPNGNSVLLEEQMQKVGDVKGNYDLAINLVQKHLAMLKVALDKNGS